MTSIVRTVGEMLQVVAPALREILTEQELAATTTRVLRQPAALLVPVTDTWPVLDDGDVLDDDTLLEVRTFDDRCGSWMQGRETAAEMFARFRSELQDHVAESAFGWGQLRL